MGVGIRGRKGRDELGGWGGQSLPNQASLFRSTSVFNFASHLSNLKSERLAEETNKGLLRPDSVSACKFHQGPTDMAFFILILSDFREELFTDYRYGGRYSDILS